MAMLSKTQIDRLGDRLRRGSFDEADLRLLDDYRRSFGPAYEAVVQAIRERLRLEPTGRPAKSTGAIIEKLHRESIRLTQIQDIAGCRVVVPESVEQEQVVSSLCGLFSGASVIDRRVNPSYGYRAVHVVVQTSKKFVEIQIRTSLQHLWAELSEKLSDVVDRTIKYGGGAPDVRTMLARSSLTVERLEGVETQLASLERSVARLPTQELRDQQTERVRNLRKELLDTKALLVEQLNKTISSVQEHQG